MVCKMCRERGQTWVGDKPKCAFEGEEFSSDNWNCATMNALRDLAGSDLNHENHWIEDTSCGVIPYEGENNTGFIVLSWYKRRGNTGTAILVYDDSAPVPITEEMALEAIAYCEPNGGA